MRSRKQQSNVKNENIYIPHIYTMALLFSLSISNHLFAIRLACLVQKSNITIRHEVSTLDFLFFCCEQQMILAIRELLR